MGGGIRLAIDSGTFAFFAGFRADVALARRVTLGNAAVVTLAAVDGGSAIGTSTASKLDSLGSGHE